MSERKLIKEWEVSAFDRVNNEWTTTMNHAYEPHVEIGEDLFTRQAVPTIIRPTKRIKPTRECSTTMFIGDTQFPFQDDRALSLARIAIQEIQPDTVVFVGDDLDMPTFSTFAQRSEWNSTLQGALDGLHEYIAQIKADSGAEVIKHEGNHDFRLERQIRQYNGDLLGLRRANAHHELGVLTVGYLLRLEELGVIHVTGYPNAEYWHEDHLKSFHGKYTVADGSTMARVISKSTVSCVQGHSHRAELVYRTFQDGRNQRTIFGLNPGTMCDFSKTPSGEFATDERGNITTQRPNWQQTVGLVYHNAEMASPHLLPITAEGIQIFDKTYRS